MLKKELIEENLKLKQELLDVCNHHKRLTEILNKKIDEIWMLKRKLNEKKKALS